MYLFIQFGEVTDVKIMSDRETGRSRGFAFVSFANKDEADKAMASLNGAVVNGREIRIDIDKFIPKV